jgi:hypothetical protein
MKYLTKWHAEYKVPMVDGKIQNPNTGQIEDASEARFYAGPPSVQTTWLNIHGESDFRIVGASFAATIDEVFVNIAEHVKDNVYSIVSISASAYSMTVVCCTPKSQTEISEVVHTMQRKLGRLVISPEERAYWDAVERAGSEEEPKMTGKSTAEKDDAERGEQ